MSVKMILAVDQGNAIGWSDGRLPWKIPADMKRFKELTTGHDVLMGRKTFESLKRPQGLPNRFNIIATSNLNGYHNDVCPTNTFINMIQAIQEPFDECGFPRTVDDLWIIGGASIYEQVIEHKLVDEIYLTLVDEDSGADVKLGFDLINWKLFVLQQAKNGIQWNLEHISAPQKTDTGLNFTFVTLKKVAV